MNRYSIIFLFAAFICSHFVFAQDTASQKLFKVLPLGVHGGIDESNLSAYMLSVEGTNNYVCLDAGTLHDGIQKAVDAGVFTVDAKTVLRNYIKGYLISHAHLDHVSGLIINSPEDTSKNIYGLPFCLNILKEKYFTWKTWANFTDEGDTPLLKKYHYVVLSSDSETAIANTTMYVRAFTLSHSNPYQSTAFLIRNKNSYVLYLGDTGADEIERSDKLHVLWQQIAPLIKAKELKAIFIEVSFPNEQPSDLLFGHLTPNLLFKELDDLKKLTGEEAFNSFKIIITHIKPSGNNEEKIKEQLDKLNTLHLNIIFPQQAVPIEF